MCFSGGISERISSQGSNGKTLRSKTLNAILVFAIVCLNILNCVYCVLVNGFMTFLWRTSGFCFDSIDLKKL